MPVITGKLSDFGFSTLTPYMPTIVFQPSAPATAPSSDGSTLLLSTRPIIVTPASDGTFSVTLVSNASTAPETWYSISIVWLDSVGGYVGTDYVPAHLSVPDTGGPITSGMLRSGLGAVEVWILAGGGIPPEAQPGDFLFDPSTDDFSRIS